jgi:lycopene cyclase CruA
MQTYLEQFSIQYPHLAAAFAGIPQADMHLRRLQDLNNTWQNMLLSGASRTYTEVVVSEERPSLPAVDTFDIIYAGGGLNLLNAAVMTLRYGVRVLVFDRFTVGAVHREWNISRQELQELLDVGLLTPAELETVIQREYSDGLVRFHSAHIQVAAAELHLKDVLNIAVDAEKLTALCMQKILQQRPLNGCPNLVLHNTTFVCAAVQPSRGVSVDVSTNADEQHSYGAALLIDGMGSTSPIACQLNCGQPFSLVCPTVGTVARGYKQGNTPDAIDPEIGEVLVTSEDARDGHQLIWEAFPGVDDQVAIYLFYYAEAGQHVDLLELFNDFFALLPSYKDTSNVEILKPVYGFIPAGYNITLPWQREQKVLAYDRVLSLGDAAAFQSPLTFCGFGSYVRNLKRITTLLNIALQKNCLSAQDLNSIRASEAVPAVARAFSKFMIARPSHLEPAHQVNETLNVFSHVLNDLGPAVTNAFFKDRISWRDYTRVVLKTPGYYPKIYSLALKTLTPTEILGWITAWLQLGRQSAVYMLYHLTKPFTHSLPGRYMSMIIIRIFPRVVLRASIYREAMEQVERGSREHKNIAARIQYRGLRHWLGRKWPLG